jgi:hypothetical protein
MTRCGGSYQRRGSVSLQSPMFPRGVVFDGTGLRTVLITLFLEGYEIEGQKPGWRPKEWQFELLRVVRRQSEWGISDRFVMDTSLNSDGLITSSFRSPARLFLSSR